MESTTRKQPRIFTIQSDVRHGITYSFKEISVLRLTGLWLMEAGFKPGQKVQVEVKRHRLIIKPAE
jgi:hypothetical protein